MKGNGIFRGIIAAVTRAFTSLKYKLTGRLPTPILQDPYHRPRTRVGTTKKMTGTKRYGYPPCVPGTITYHDKLVRHFGRRYADKIGWLIRQGRLDLLPSDADFARTAARDCGVIK